MPSLHAATTLVKVSTSNCRWPLRDAAASRHIERTALAAFASTSVAASDNLMERAGLAVARLALAIAPHARRVRVCAGPGNNGGDGLVAARHLHLHGLLVDVYLLGDAAALPADAARALQQATRAGVAVHTGTAPQVTDARVDVVIDALLGLGASRAPTGAIAAAINSINVADVPVLAIDLPSGLHPDTGALLGDAAVRATATLSLLTLKPGCFTATGRDHAGEVWLDTLGVVNVADPDAVDPSAWLSGAPASAPRAHATHKGSFGDVAIVGGGVGMTGAAWLAARAASAAGAGRVHCSLLDTAAPLLDPVRPELMGRQAWWLSSPALLAKATVTCGCGGGDAVRQVLPPLLAHVRRLVLDADALNAIASDSALQASLRARAGRGLQTLLTPHPLEAAQLLGIGTKALQADRLGAAQALAERTAAAVLLKGSGSIMAAPGAVPRINPTGNAALASAGTGDVLAGWAAGLWAQHAEAAAADIAAASAWQHGQAADDWLREGHQGPLRASELIERLAARR